jgi:ribonuclease-3
MRPRLHSPSGPNAPREGRPLELVRVRGSQRNSGDGGRGGVGRSRRRGGRGRSRGGPRPQPPRRSFSLWGWLKSLFPATPRIRSERPRSLSEQEARAIAEFCRHYDLTFKDPGLLKLALTHRSYLSVTGQGPRESNERLEFLGDSVLGLVTSEFLYRQHPDEHEGQLTKTKSLLVSKAILSRRALAMGLGRFVLMSHSEVESGGRQRLSILADAFESVVGAVYLDQGFEAARTFIHRWLLKDSREIAADKRHTNYKSHLQEYVQSTFHTHPVYRIRSEVGPDHSKQFLVEVMVGKRMLGSGKGRNKKEAEQAAARDALEKVGAPHESETEARDARDEREARDVREARIEREPRAERDSRGEREPRRDRESRGERSARPPAQSAAPVRPGSIDLGEGDEVESGRRRRGRRGGRGRRPREQALPPPALPPRVPEPETVLDEEGYDEPAPSVERTEPRSAGYDRDVPRRFESRVSVPRAISPAPVQPASEVEPIPPAYEEDENEEVGRPDGPLEDRHVDPYAWDPPAPPPRATATVERPEHASREIEPAGEAAGTGDSWVESAEPEEADPPKDSLAREAPPRSEEPDDSDEDEQVPGSLFSHERETPAPAEPQRPSYGRRGRRRGR